MNAKQKKDLVKKTWAQIQKEVKKILNDNRVKEVQGLVKRFLNKAQHDYARLLKGDITVNVKILKKELKSVERMINQMIHTELKKAESFLKVQKRELSKFQSKLEAALKKRGVKVKSSSNKSTKKKAKKTSKKTTKKSAS